MFKVFIYILYFDGFASVFQCDDGNLMDTVFTSK